MAYTFRDGTVCAMHIPKCAGRGMARAIMLSEGKNAIVNDGHKHDLPQRWDYDLMFAIVREPAEWLRSFWGHRNSGRWSVDTSKNPYTLVSRMVQPYATDDFDKFAWDVTENLPGMIGWFFGMYTPPPVKVVKLEDAGTFLKEEFGADFEAEHIGAREGLPEITQVTRDLVIMAEVATYIRYKWKVKNV